MNRRGFLKLFAGAAAGAIVAPKVSYFFAPEGGWQPSGVWASNGQLAGFSGVSLAEIEKSLNDVFCNYAICPDHIWVSEEMAEEIVRRFAPIRRPIYEIGDKLEVFGTKITPTKILHGNEIVPTVPKQFAHLLPLGFPTDHPAGLYSVESGGRWVDPRSFPLGQ